MDKSQCLVSILCTVYNHEEFVASALEGFVNQETDFAFEVLINDDASTDSSANIIRDYAERYPDIIRPFYQEVNQFSKGIGWMYENVLFPNAKGKYLAFCEGDDYWTDMLKLRQQVDFLERHGEYSACVHNTTLHYCNGAKPDELLIEPQGDHDVPFENIIKGPSSSYHTSSILARREIITQTPAFYRAATAHGFADYGWALMLRLAGPIYFIDKPMSVYRLNSNESAWTSGVDGQYKKLRGFVEGKVEMLKAFLPHAPEEQRENVRREILEREFELMYIEGRDAEQRKGPYRDILRKQSFSYRAKNFIKSYFPAVQRYYRRRQGYTE